MDKKISTPIAITLVIACAVLVGLAINWQFGLFPIEQWPNFIPRKITEDKTTNWKTYRNNDYGIELVYPADYSLTGFGDKLAGDFPPDTQPVKTEFLDINDLKLDLRSYRKFSLTYSFLGGEDTFEKFVSNERMRRQWSDLVEKEVTANGAKGTQLISKDWSIETDISGQGISNGTILTFWEKYGVIYTFEGISVGENDSSGFVKLYDRILSSIRITKDLKGFCLTNLKYKGQVIEKITDESLRGVMIPYFYSSLNLLWGFKPENGRLCGNEMVFTVGGGTMDLNNDEMPEYIVFPGELYLSGEFYGYVRGNSGCGTIYVFGFSQGKWRLIGNLDGGNAIKKIESRINKGYQNLGTSCPYGVDSGVYDEYTWNGESYEHIKEYSYGPLGSDPMPEEFKHFYDDSIGYSSGLSGLNSI